MDPAGISNYSFKKTLTMKQFNFFSGMLKSAGIITLIFLIKCCSVGQPGSEAKLYDLDTGMESR